MNLVFFLEGRSEKVMLQGLLLKFFSAETIKHYVVFVEFEGKSDLEKQIVKKIRDYLGPRSEFIILRDQDSDDCIKIKNRLLEKCRKAGKSNVIVRVACRELESWYLGDLAAVETGLDLNNIAKHQKKRKYRDPDSIGNPVAELQKLTRGKYQKISGSRSIGPHLSLQNNRSHSFCIFVSALEQLRQKVGCCPCTARNPSS